MRKYLVRHCWIFSLSLSLSKKVFVFLSNIIPRIYGASSLRFCLIRDGTNILRGSFRLPFFLNLIINI